MAAYRHQDKKNTCAFIFRQKKILDRNLFSAQGQSSTASDKKTFIRKGKNPDSVYPYNGLHLMEV